MRRSLPAVLVALVVAAGLALVSQPAANGRAGDAASDVVSLVRVHTTTRADRQRVADLGLDTSETGGVDWVGVVLHGAADAGRLEAAGFTWTVQIPDLVKREQERAALDAQYAAAANSKPMPSGRTAYRSLDDYVFDMKELAKRNPGLVKLIKLPNKTTEGRTVWGVEITDQVMAKDGKPIFAILGTHHAREWTAGEHTIEFAFDLVKAWKAGDPRTHDLLSRARVIAVPLVNPDGFNASFTAATIFDGTEVQGVDGARGGDSLLYTGVQAAGFPAYKRKNCRMVDGADTPAGSCMAPGARQLGTDPNRNYGALWGGAGASAFPADDIYRGPAPFSEPESQNIRELVSHRQVTMLVTNHTFAGLVLHAPGVQSHGVTVDEDAMKLLGQRMADANGSINQAGFELYDTTGTTEDWSYGTTGGFGYTFEIPVLEFHPPFSETVDAYDGTGKIAGKGDHEAYYIALEAAANAAYHSVITADAPVGAVLRLQKSFDTTTSPVRNAETQFTDDPGTAGDALTFRDALDTTMVSTGQVSWHVNPSTRPAVMERHVLDVIADPSRTWKHEGDVPAMNEHVDVPFTLTAEDQSRRLDIELDWPNPDDLDLEVYRRDGAKLVEVGSSGGTFTEKEHLSLDRPVPGDYVLRVINYTGGSEPFSLTAATFREGVTKVHPALKPFEEWTLTCLTPTGTVLQRTKVQVNRGGSVHVDLGECRTRWPA